MKKIIALALAAAICLPVLVGCKKDEAGAPGTTAPVLTGKEALKGKKVIFFGNSHLYYGNCVADVGQTTDINKRVNDQGLFYQFCKANGVEVKVTNYSFGVHQLSDFYSHSCAANRGHDGHDHMADLGDLNYDYVVLQEGTKAEGHDLINSVKKMMELFTAKNPNVKFIFMPHLLAYTAGYDWLGQVKDLEALGVTVVDWGGLLNAIINGEVQVPGTEQTYKHSSFVISQSAKDGYHPNLLTGYITAMMTYCAITGEKAETLKLLGADSIVGDAVALSTFRSRYYTFNNETNFEEVLLSKTEMQGIQKLIDQYTAK